MPLNTETTIHIEQSNEKQKAVQKVSDQKKDKKSRIRIR